MPGKSYTERELEQLFVLFTMNTPISEIERKLLRPAEGIVKKVVRLSRENPKIWSKFKAEDYARTQRKERWDNGGNEEFFDMYYNKGGKERVRQYREEHREQINKKLKAYRQRGRGRWKVFGNYLGELIDNFDGTQRKAANKAGIHPDALSRYRCGNAKPSDRTVLKLAQALNVPYETLREKLK